MQGREAALPCFNRRGAGLLPVLLIDRGPLGSLETNLCPGRGLPDEVAVSGFERESCVMEVEQGEAGGTSAFDAAPSIPLRVVARVPLAPGLNRSAILSL